MDRLVSVDTKEILLHYTPPCRDRNGRRQPRKPQQGTKFSFASSTTPQSRRRGCCSATFRVTNLMHTMSVAVHLSTTRPSSFSFSPPSALAVLQPLCSRSFSLHYLPHSPSPDGDAADEKGPSSPPLPSPPDTVVVRSALLPTGKADATHLLGLFSGPPIPQIFTDARVPISFVGPDALLSLLRLSTRSPSSPSSAPLTLDTAFLLSKAASACSPSELSSLLLPAAAAGNPRFVSALLDAGAEPNHRGDADRSALSLAVAAGSLETVEVLLEFGAMVEPDLDRLIMHDAAAENRADVMDAVADAASWWAASVDSAGRTPLHVAAAHGHVEAARFCLTSPSGGCDPDRPDANGWTPLHHAAACGSLEVAALLLERCSYATKYALTANTRKTPFDLAVDAPGDNSRLLDLLRLGDLLHRAAAVGDVGGVRGCLARGAAVNGRDQNGWTPLHRAAFKGRVEVAEVLIAHGAGLDARDGAGWTPLRCAAEAGRGELVVLLVARGAAQSGLKGLAAGTEGLGCRGASGKGLSGDAPGTRSAAATVLPSLCVEGDR